MKLYVTSEIKLKSSAGKFQRSFFKKTPLTTDKNNQ